MRLGKVAAVLIIAFCAASASAQVHRCKDAAGRLIFSDKACDSGQSGEMVQRKRTRDEILREREQAFDAENRKQARRAAEQEREFAEQERRNRQAQAMPQVQQPADDWQARKNRENAATSAGSIANNGSRWDAKAEAERAAQRREEARRRQAVQKEFMLTCTGGMCTDEYGATYSGSGSVFTRSDGRTCSMSGSMAFCP